MMTVLHPERLSRVKRAFSTRRIPDDVLRGLDHQPNELCSGDLVLARVSWIGQHANIELPHGRKSKLRVGDEIIVACGARYAPDQFFARIPETTGPANLVASGGIAAIELLRHAKMKEATGINIVGRLTDEMQKPVNLADYALPLIPNGSKIPIIAVVGTSMNAGKTTTCAALLQGFANAGFRPAYVKATGTGSGVDIWALRDAGAEVALDFTDAGYASTCNVDTVPLVEHALSLAAHAEQRHCNIIIMEIADGLLQRETASILRNKNFQSRLNGTVLAAADSMGAVSAYSWLQSEGHNVLGISGALTQSPLSMQEVQDSIGLLPKTVGELGKHIFPDLPGHNSFHFQDDQKIEAVA